MGLVREAGSRWRAVLGRLGTGGSGWTRPTQKAAALGDPGAAERGRHLWAQAEEQRRRRQRPGQRQAWLDKGGRLLGHAEGRSGGVRRRFARMGGGRSQAKLRDDAESSWKLGSGRRFLRCVGNELT